MKKQANKDFLPSGCISIPGGFLKASVFGARDAIATKKVENEI